MRFLYTKPEALPAEVCDALVSLFESSKELHVRGETAQGYDPKHKSDTEISIDTSRLAQPEWAMLLAPVFRTLHEGIETYKTTCVGLDLMKPWALSAPFNMQRYLPGEGYTSLHCEVDSKDESRIHRVLTWIIYLNTVTDEGGTFFPNQETTVSAEKGKLLISPAYWTHPHRGVISPTQSKYILTGWYSFC